jgi:hypothetical protein
LGHIIEQADRGNVTARDVIQAAYTYAHVNDDGMWVQPASKSEIVVSKIEAAASPVELSPGSPSPLVRSVAKPPSRRRAPRHIPAPQDLGKIGQESDAGTVAAYVQASIPDTAIPSRAVMEAAELPPVLLHNVPRPNRDPSPPETPVLISRNEAHGINTK